MKFKNLKKLLSFIGTTTLVASPIIAMGGGLLGSKSILEKNKIENNNLSTKSLIPDTFDKGTILNKFKLERDSSLDKTDWYFYTLNAIDSDGRVIVDRIAGFWKPKNNDTGHGIYCISSLPEGSNSAANISNKRFSIEVNNNSFIDENGLSIDLNNAELFLDSILLFECKQSGSSINSSTNYLSQYIVSIEWNLPETDIIFNGVSLKSKINLMGSSGSERYIVDDFMSYQILKFRNVFIPEKNHLSNVYSCAYSHTIPFVKFSILDLSYEINSKVTFNKTPTLYFSADQIKFLDGAYTITTGFFYNSIKIARESFEDFKRQKQEAEEKSNETMNLSNNESWYPINGLNKDKASCSINASFFSGIYNKSTTTDNKHIKQKQLVILDILNNMNFVPNITVGDDSDITGGRAFSSKIDNETILYIVPPNQSVQNLIDSSKTNPLKYAMAPYSNEVIGTYREAITNNKYNWLPYRTYISSYDFSKSSNEIYQNVLDNHENLNVSSDFNNELALWIKNDSGSYIIPDQDLEKVYSFDSSLSFASEQMDGLGVQPIKTSINFSNIANFDDSKLKFNFTKDNGILGNVNNEMEYTIDSKTNSTVSITFQPLKYYNNEDNNIVVTGTYDGREFENTLTINAKKQGNNTLSFQKSSVSSKNLEAFENTFTFTGLNSDTVGFNPNGIKIDIANENTPSNIVYTKIGNQNPSGTYANDFTLEYNNFSGSKPTSSGFTFNLKRANLPELNSITWIVKLSYIPSSQYDDRSWASTQFTWNWTKESIINDNNQNITSNNKTASQSSKVGSVIGLTLNSTPLTNIVVKEGSSSGKDVTSSCTITPTRAGSSNNEIYVTCKWNGELNANKELYVSAQANVAEQTSLSKDITFKWTVNYQGPNFSALTKDQNSAINATYGNSISETNAIKLAHFQVTNVDSYPEEELDLGISVTNFTKPSGSDTKEKLHLKIKPGNKSGSNQEYNVMFYYDSLTSIGNYTFGFDITNKGSKVDSLSLGASAFTINNQYANANFTNWTPISNKNLGDFNYSEAHTSNIKLASFSVDNLDNIDKDNLNSSLSAEFNNFKKDGSASSENSKFTLSIDQNGADSGSTRSFDVNLKWSSTTIAAGSYTFDIKLKRNGSDVSNCTATGYSLNINYAAPIFSDITTKETNKNISVGSSQNKLVIGSFSINNYDKIDQSKINLTAEFKNWSASNGTTKDNITLVVEKNGSGTTSQNYDIKATWAEGKFTKKDVISFGIIVKNNGGEIKATGNSDYQWNINYVNITSITVAAEDNQVSRTIKEWGRETSIIFNATPNPNTNIDPDAFNDADWVLEGDTANDAIQLEPYGQTATLKIPGNLDAGKYVVTIKCTALGVASNLLSYTIDKQYIDYNKSNYEITGGTTASATANITGTAATTLSVSAKSEPAGIDPSVGNVKYSIRGVSCDGDPSLTDSSVRVNKENKLEWDPIRIATSSSVVTFTIVATLLDHNNDTIEVAGQINVSSKYAKDVTIKENQTTVNEATIIAGKESRIGGVVQIADVKDDTNSTNWDCNYEGKYALSWDGQGDVDNYFTLVSNSSPGNGKIQDLVCKNTLAPGSYNLSIVYQFKTNGDDSGLSGTSNRVSLTVNVVYDAPSSGDITISGDNALVGTVAEEGKSGKYKYNIANANKNDPDATISYRIEVNGDKYSGGIELENQKSDKSTIITWNDTLAKGSYTIKLYARYRSGTTDVESDVKTITLTIDYANVNSVAIEGNKNIDANSESKSSQFNIKPTSENGNINSIDPNYKENNNYTWSISSTDEKTMEAINNRWITINASTGQLTWTEDLDAGYSYQLTITATHTTQGSSLSATFTTTISSKKPINWVMIGGIVCGVIGGIILLTTLGIIISKISGSKKYLTNFERTKQ